MKKVIQIAVAVHEGKGSHNYPDMLYALCDDGTIWYCSCLAAGEEWRRVSGIPQNRQEFQTEVEHLGDVLKPIEPPLFSVAEGSEKNGLLGILKHIISSYELTDSDLSEAESAIAKAEALK